MTCTVFLTQNGVTKVGDAAFGIPFHAFDAHKFLMQKRLYQKAASLIRSDGFERK